MENLQPIHVFATWKVKEGQVQHVLHTLRAVRAASVQEEGNLFYNIHQGKTDENTIVLFEGYKNEAAIDEHRNSAHYKELVLGTIVPLLEKREVVLTTPLSNL